MDVLYEDERIIVVDKPHFLATMPRGMWYRQTALIRLRERLGEPDITPAHRLDRMTAGVLVFVRDPACRGAYQMLFQNRQAVKVYECLAPCRPISRPRFGTIMKVEPPCPRSGMGIASRWREVARSAGGWSPSGKSPHLPLHTPPAHRQNPPIARPHEFARPAHRG